jgi:CBS domain-containing protein
MKVVRRVGTPVPKPVTVRDLMAHSVVTVDPRESLTGAAAQMRASRIGSLVVLADGEITGIITERDLMRAIADERDPGLTHVSQYMTPSPRIVEATRGAAQAATLMVRHGLRHLPVVEDGQLVGLLSARDLLALEPWPRTLPPLEPW